MKKKKLISYPDVPDKEEKDIPGIDEKNSRREKKFFFSAYH